MAASSGSLMPGAQLPNTAGRETVEGLPFAKDLVFVANDHAAHTVYFGRVDCVL